MSTDPKPIDPHPGDAGAWDSSRVAGGGQTDMPPRPPDPPPPQTSPMPDGPMVGPAPHGTKNGPDQAAPAKP